MKIKKLAFLQYFNKNLILRTPYERSLVVKHSKQLKILAAIGHASVAELLVDKDPALEFETQEFDHWLDSKRNTNGYLKC